MKKIKAVFYFVDGSTYSFVGPEEFANKLKEFLQRVEATSFDSTAEGSTVWINKAHVMRVTFVEEAE